MAPESTPAAGAPLATGDTSPSAVSTARPTDAAQTVSLSSFTRAPGAVLPLLETGPVLLTRRQGGPMLLTLAADASADDQAEPPPASEEPYLDSDPAPDLDLAHLLTHLLPALTAQQLEASLSAGLPWIDQLPPAARRAMVEELSLTRGFPVHTGLIPTLVHWQSTAVRFAKPTQP